MIRVQFPLLPGALRWLGAVTFAAVLVYFSLVTVPPPEPPDPSLGAPWDKKLHFAGYAALGLSLLYATAPGRESRTRRAVLTIGTTVAFGVLIEVLQGPIPYRYFSLADLLANALGALLATGWFLLEARLEYVRFPR